MDQLETARRIADKMSDDGFEVAALDLLDYMGIVGVVFAPGDPSEAYQRGVREATLDGHRPKPPPVPGALPPE